MRYCYFVLLLCFTSSLFGQVAICYNEVNVALPTDECTTNILPDWIDAGSYVPSGMTKITYVVNGFNLAPGSHTVHLRVEAYRRDGSLAGRNTCWSTVHVQDKTDPVAECHDQTYYLVDPAQPITFNTGDLYTFTDNCATTDLQISVIDATGFGTYPFSGSVSDPSGNTDNCSGTITIADGEPQNYCSASRNAYYEHIRRVRLTAAGNTQEENTGNDGGYRHHFPSGDNILYHGYDYTLAYDPGFSSSTYHEYWRVYLDKNGDGDFTDAGELLHQWNGYGGNSFSFTSPGTYWGWSRIRVVMSYGGYGSPCGGGYGEVEDISVFLRPFFIIIWPWPQQAIASAGVDFPAHDKTNEVVLAEDRPVQGPRPGEVSLREDQASTATLNVYPNPAAAGSQLTVSGLVPETTLLLRDFNGRVLARYPITNPLERIDLPTTLPAGIYLLGQQRIMVQ
ncbi:MAG: T9SS type A sorting domain-containing protein [Bacteroidota bacterium]